MSRAAGTLITTNNATYIPPRFMPGYRGHCPTTKFDYGETYGSATSKHFQDYRSDVLRSSKTPYHKGGEFPTFYSHNPEIVLSNRNRGRDRYIAAPKFSLSNVDNDRKEELYKFNQLSQSHRDHYTDKSNTAKRVDYFMIPTKAEDQFKKHLQFMIMSTRHIDDINLPTLKHLARRRPLVKDVTLKSSARDREMRDVHFECR